MLALRLVRGSQPGVQLRRLLVATASAATGFLLLGTLGHALAHQDTPGGSVLRLAWCVTPLAATVYFAVTVARADPGTRPRPGLSAIGLGPARLMAVSATTTALSCTLGSMVALLFFLHLRGDLTGMPFDGDAADFLAADRPLPLPAALTLLTLVPLAASLSVALTLRPRDTRPTPSGATRLRRYGRFGAEDIQSPRETFGAYGRFGARLRRPTADNTAPTSTPTAGTTAPGAAQARPTAGSSAAGAARVGAGGTPQAPGSASHPPAATPGTPETPDQNTDTAPAPTDPHALPTPQPTPRDLPWGIAVLAAGLAVEAYATRAPHTRLAMPGGATGGSAAVLVGWTLTALGLALAGPGLTHLCGRLLQAVRPGALRLLAGRVLMEEATRIGRPLGVVCAVASGAYAMIVLYADASDAPSLGPLATLGALVVAGCAVATLLTAAAEARHARADTTAALLRLGAPATALRTAAGLRAAALLALFAPLTLLIAELAALPLTA
ncbi:hypothetical protein [Streptomyces turgidiscabies]|uniref:Integral membrane protein n=1 Tax=Streptomyces turgidiscabies TaxID=85558 RepID=A0ABU0RMV2_9ACTN|nr:hypothetical protein [Streptomyces turgidiscabies]MDQ0933028.1 hypothetical protein [Streptomyces turgidiscabies]